MENFLLALTVGVELKGNALIEISVVAYKD